MHALPLFHVHGLVLGLAFVVVSTALEPAELASFVANQLSPHKRPREVRIVTELPRNAMGKVQKALLKEKL